MAKKIFAYLRVSTDAQDVENQKHGIKQYAVEKGFNNVEYVSTKILSNNISFDTTTGSDSSAKLSFLI
jgi:hypothetical protein